MKCYSCFSYRSEAICEQDLWLKSCQSKHHDACTKFTVNLTLAFGSTPISQPLTGYGRTCGSLHQCKDQSCIDFWGKDINLNRLVSILDCKIVCCQGDGCHTSKPPTNPLRNNKERTNLVPDSVFQTDRGENSKNGGQRLTAFPKRISSCSLLFIPLFTNWLRSFSPLHH